jgi:ferrous iron transport protein A
MKLFHLHDLALNTPARIASIDWAALGPAEAQRLRAFGFDIGAHVEPLHRAGLIARDPIAIKIGRMTVAVRRAVAAAIQVQPL